MRERIELEGNNKNVSLPVIRSKEIKPKSNIVFRIMLESPNF